MSVYGICFVQASSAPVPDNITVNAMDTFNSLVESSIIGQNGAPINQGVAMFTTLTPGVTYTFVFPGGVYANRILTMPLNPQIIVGAPGPPGGPYDLIQTFEVSNTGPTTIFTHVVSRQFTIMQNPASLGIHQGYCAFAQNTQTVVFNLNKNAISFGTLTFSPLTAAGVFNIVGTESFNPGDFLSIDFLSSSDFTLVGDLNMNNFIITLCTDLT